MAFMSKPGLFIVLIPSMQLDLWQSFYNLKRLSCAFPRLAVDAILDFESYTPVIFPDLCATGFQ